MIFFVCGGSQCLPCLWNDTKHLPSLPCSFALARNVCAFVHGCASQLMRDWQQIQTCSMQYIFDTCIGSLHIWNSPEVDALLDFQSESYFRKVLLTFPHQIIFHLLQNHYMNCVHTDIVHYKIFWSRLAPGEGDGEVREASWVDPWANPLLVLLCLCPPHPTSSHIMWASSFLLSDYPPLGFPHSESRIHNWTYVYVNPFS